MTAVARSPGLRFKATTLDDGDFRGLGATFGNVDLGGELIEPGAFIKSLAEHAAEDVMPALLWAHDPREPIGTWLDLRETDEGLAVHGKLTLGVPRGAAAHALMKDDALALSIGYEPIRWDFDSDGVKHLIEVKLWEISTVALPMNRRARITAVKSALADIRAFERFAREDWGLSAREARRLAAGGFKALANPSAHEEQLCELARMLRVGATIFEEPHNADR